MRLTLPTILTLFRIALLPVMVIVFYAPFQGANIAASGIFIAAALTDWLDGWIARRFGMTSTFGEFLDPVADKLMVAVTLFLLVQDNPTIPLAVISAIIVGPRNHDFGAARMDGGNRRARTRARGGHRQDQDDRAVRRAWSCCCIRKISTALDCSTSAKCCWGSPRR